VDLASATSGGAPQCIVIDYKSGGKKIDPLLLEHGAQIQLPAYLAALRHVSASAPELFGPAPLVAAGAFYVNLRGDYPSGGDRAEVLDDDGRARQKAYRHTGRFSRAALPQLDRRAPGGHSGQFNYQLTNDGKPHKAYKDLLEPGPFAALLDRVEEVLRAMGRRIFSGDATIDPYRKGGRDACEFCECQAICRIDPWQHTFRVLRKAPVNGEVA